MKASFFEHVGINVSDKDAVVSWYTKNLGLAVVRDIPGKMAFLGDPDGVLALEIYENRNADRVDFGVTDALALHLAFEVEDPQSVAQELTDAGATIVDPYKTAGEDSMVMLRDPFGIPLQLVKRGNPMRMQGH